MSGRPDAAPLGGAPAPRTAPAPRLLRVVAAQFGVRRNDPDAALRLGLSIVREAAGSGCDLVLFPELWSTGCALPVDPALALELDGAWVGAFRQAATDLGVGIAVTLLARSERGPTNACLVIGRRGEVLLQHDKVHCAVDSEACLVPGTGFEVCSFDGVTLGVLTCFDREFPESARELMLAGAELVLVPNASRWNPVRAHQLEARAFENMLAIAMCNYPGDGWGQSSAYSPVVFDAHERPLDPLLARADASVQLVPYVFDVAAIRSWREREVWGAVYRRPDAYRRLASEGPGSGQHAPAGVR